MGDLVIKEEIFKKWTPLSKGEGTETLSRPRSMFFLAQFKLLHSYRGIILLLTTHFDITPAPPNFSEKYYLQNAL